MNNEKITRHTLIDRVIHWLFAASILTLLLTGLLPALGIKFAWVTIHWIAGVCLILLLLAHTIRALFIRKSNRGSMWLGPRDFKIALTELKSSATDVEKPGKYSLAQKLMHQCVALLAVVVSITGALMMVKIDTPFWPRNPYWLQADTWGIVYVLHGLIALMFVSVIMLHIYFSIRPEKRLYLRSMLLGWITRKELEDNHNADVWPKGGIDRDK